LKDVTSLTLQGFTIQNFVNRGDGGAFHLENSTLILQNCVLKGNSAISYGNGGAIFATKKSTVIIENSIFSDIKPEAVAESFTQTMVHSCFYKAVFCKVRSAAAFS